MEKYLSAAAMDLLITGEMIPDSKPQRFDQWTKGASVSSKEYPDARDQLEVELRKSFVSIKGLTWFNQLTLNLLHLVSVDVPVSEPC